jgi:2-oxoglutarate ferredoxin oxidoreductase subunit alpha
VTHPTTPNGANRQTFLPYLRDKNHVRPWAIPGTPGLEHRLGGLEKQDITGNVSYDPSNHEHMVKTRAAKVAGIQPAGDAYLWTGPEAGQVLLLGWGSTYGAIKAATLDLQKDGIAVSQCHLRYLNPMPDLSKIFKNFDHVLVPELNLGQLQQLVRARWLIDAKGLNKIRGQPFTIGEIVRATKSLLEGKEMKLDRSARDVVGAGGG